MKPAEWCEAELLHPVKPTPGSTGAPVRSAWTLRLPPRLRSGLRQEQGRFARAPVPTPLPI